MSSNSYTSASKWVLVALALGFAASNANAQGKFVGSWSVTEAVKPDWIEPTSPPPVAPAKIGDIVEFGETFVRGDSPFSCEDARLEIVNLRAADYFGGGMANAADIKKSASDLGLAGAARVLRVDCASGVFDYHEGDGKLVLAFDNMVYTLERMQPKR